MGGGGWDGGGIEQKKKKREKAHGHGQSGDCWGKGAWGVVEESIRGISGGRVLTWDGESTLHYEDDVL